MSEDVTRSPTQILAGRLRWIAIGSIVALLVPLVGWLLADMSVGRLVLVVILAIPVLLALPRLWAGERRAYQWTTLAIIPYLVFAITEAVADPSSRAWAGACLAVAFLSFVALIAYLRATRLQTDRLSH